MTVNPVFPDSHSHPCFTGKVFQQSRYLLLQSADALGREGRAAVPEHESVAFYSDIAVDRYGFIHNRVGGVNRDISIVRTAVEGAVFKSVATYGDITYRP